MLGFVIIFVLLAIGFAAGYTTRGLVSRKRHAEYLKFQPYTSPTLRPGRSSSEGRARTRRAASEPPMAAKRRTSHDITRSFQSISIHGREPAKPKKPADADVHPVQAHRSEADVGSLQPANVEQSLEELVALLQRRTQES
jgi:hypothetical protein